MTPQTTRWMIRLGLLALALAVVVYQNAQDDTPPPALPLPPPPQEDPSQNNLSHLFDAARQAGFTVYPDASLVEHRNNDGDSFLLSHREGEAHVRLYFVDAPESYLAAHNSDRLGHQARYFNRQIPEAVAAGQEAKTFTTELLRRSPFALITRHEPVFDSDRIFGFIVFSDGSYLAEHLVAAGLARIYTQGTDTPDGRARREFERHLKSLESQARQQGRGAWLPSKNPSPNP
jgi:endonuclease YncB( thermonuclease family)